MREVRKVMPTWIPVDRRLPEKRTRVLICSGGYVGVGIYTGAYWRDEYNSIISVKNWMPLPKPAKEVS